MQGVFEIGKALEDHVVKRVKDAGYEVITPTYRSFRIEPQNITGRDDLRIKDTETGDLIPVEVKSVIPYVFDKLNKFEDFVNHKKAHIRAYAAQMQLYMLHFGKEYGFFALINKQDGRIKFIRCDFDYDYCEKILSKADYINDCLTAKEPPEACDEIGLCENCDLAHICGTCKRTAVDVELDDELDKLINRKTELAKAVNEYYAVDNEIKARVGEREKVLTGDYIIERKPVSKEAYTVPASTYYRLNIKRL